MPASIQDSSPADQRHWLSQYYVVRAAFSLVRVVLASTAGQNQPTLGAFLLVLYPLWDAAANYVDARRSGGFGKNRTQALNTLVSAVTTLAVVVALQVSLSAVLATFGVWAILSGLFQLATAIRRRKASGAQWAMLLSGAQSALAGGFFVYQAQQVIPAVLPILAGYAAFGAIYFLLSALTLVLGRQKRAQDF
ncbi:DUF308 domain-containing protein [Devosia sp.]|jgi:hypothetical protein|uniref:DUF308 domain-containing protein n=1 Tax=Devosia sp. TaxID=1871048 RepID=UPI002F94C175